MPAYIPEKATERRSDEATRGTERAAQASATPGRHAEADIVVRETCQRKRIPITWGSRLDDAVKLCRLWGSLFGKNACYVLNDDRLRAIMRRLVTEGWSYDQVRGVILAYERRTHDQWHRDRGHPATTLEDLLDPQHDWRGSRKRRDVFEDLVPEGEAIMRKQHVPCVSMPQPPQQTAAARLYREWNESPPDRRRAVLQAAIAECKKRPSFYGYLDERHPQIRQAIVRIMQTGLPTEEPRA